MTNDMLIDFLRGTGLDSRGRYHADILRFSDEELEGTDDYIQWLFPLREPSRVVPDSPFLESEDIVRVIREDEDIRENLVIALTRMRLPVDNVVGEFGHELRSEFVQRFGVLSVREAIAFHGAAGCVEQIACSRSSGKVMPVCNAI